MSLTIDKIDYHVHENGQGALKSANGTTASKAAPTVTASVNGMAFGGNLKVQVDGDAWTATVDAGDGNFTAPVTITITARTGQDAPVHKSFEIKKP